MKNNRFILIHIAYIGAMVALQVILGNLIQIPTPIKQLHFGFLPIAVTGYLLGPMSAMLVAALGDVVGTLLFGTGAYFPGFTVTAALVGIVYGLVLSPKYFRWIGNISSSKARELWMRALVAVIIASVINHLLNSYWLTYFITSRGYWAILVGRLPFSLIEIPVFTIVITICCAQMKRLPRILLPDEIRRNIIGKP